MHLQVYLHYTCPSSSYTSTHSTSTATPRLPRATATISAPYHGTYTGHGGLPVWCVAWSPDGKRIASGGVDKTVQVWDPVTGRTLLTYRGHTEKVQVAAWSPDGKYIASGSDDTTVQIWDATTGTLELPYRG